MTNQDPTPKPDLTVQSEELLPCPFCGTRFVSYDILASDPPQYKIYCNRCPTRLGEIFKTKEAAVKAWNARSYLKELRAQHSEIRDLRERNQRLVEEVEHINCENSGDKDYATRLIKLLTPQCEPCDTMIGLILQLDHYIASQNKEIERLKEQVARFQKLTCEIDSYSSRACELGTRSCVRQHYQAIPKPTDVPVSGETTKDPKQV